MPHASACAGFECARESRVARLNRRHYPRNQAGDHRYADSERRDSTVERRVGPRNLGHDERAQQCSAPPGRDESGPARQRREDQRFGRQHPNEPRARDA